MDNSQPSELNIEILTPTQTLYQGQAATLSSYNSTGPFDILPEHSHFISIIEKEIVIRNTSEEKKFPIDVAVLRCFNNDIKIYIGLGSMTASTTASSKNSPSASSTQQSV